MDWHLKRRARKWGPKIIGLTGSIAMGKSTAARLANQLGLPVFDSDATSRALTANNGAALPAISKTFPGTVRGDSLDRKALAEIVFNAPKKLAQLEAIIHPLVKKARKSFLQNAIRQRRKTVIFDIPLLFETGSSAECDAVIVVDAPNFLQRQRVMARPGMSTKTFAGIRARQTPNATKRHLADVIIPSGLGLAFTLRHLKKAIKFKP
jgi:dephospho-CoA kinase